MVLTRRRGFQQARSLAIVFLFAVFSGQVIQGQQSGKKPATFPPSQNSDRAQIADVSGPWDGTRTENGGPVRDFTFHFDLKQSGTSISGTSRREVAANRSAFAVTSVSGTLGGSTLSLQDTGFVQQGQLPSGPGSMWCLTKMTFTVIDANHLSGAWVQFAPAGCTYSGTMDLRRAACSSTEDIAGMSYDHVRALVVQYPDCRTPALKAECSRLGNFQTAGLAMEAPAIIGLATLIWELAAISESRDHTISKALKACEAFLTTPASPPLCSPRDPDCFLEAPGNLPNSNRDWGRNRLLKELHDRRFIYQGPTNSERGFMYRNLQTGEEVRIMPRPQRAPFANEPLSKFENKWYYRYRSGPDQPWGPHTTLADPK